MRIERNVDLTGFNTFGFHTTASEYCEINSLDEFLKLRKEVDLTRTRHFILGGGSNVLFVDPEFKGLVIHNKVCGVEIVNQTKDQVDLRIGSGEVWHNLVLHCVENDWGGIENLSLIPGTVGAAPIQNIGAYGVEIKDVLLEVEAVDIETGEVVTFNSAQCSFGYRDSIFKRDGKGRYFISSVTLRLTQGEHQIRTTYGAIQKVLEEQGVDKPTIRDVSSAVIHIRQSKLPDPSKIGNAGSFFKNPTISNEQYENLLSKNPDLPSFPVDHQMKKIPAGWLIESCGYKGVVKGAVGVHQHQALVLVNFGNGKGADVLALADEIKEQVRNKFGIELEKEVNIIS